MACSRSPEADEGYAALSALIVCLALSLFVAAFLALAIQMDKTSVRAFTQARRDEALNEALMRFAADTGENTVLARIETRYVIDGFPVTVTGEDDMRKWPLTAAAIIGDATLAAHSHSLDVATARNLAAQAMAAQKSEKMMLTLPRNDCFRRLFSPYGQATPQVAMDTAPRARQAEVWRLRAVAGPYIRESYVRFIGDTDQLYAVLSEETFPTQQEPPCAS